MNDALGTHKVGDRERERERANMYDKVLGILESVINLSNTQIFYAGIGFHVSDGGKRIPHKLKFVAGNCQCFVGG